jgi:Zn-dependent oligopeptidase
MKVQHKFILMHFSPSEILASIDVTHEQGGMEEYMLTGVYPDYLSFTCKVLKTKWRRKYYSKSQKGSLKSAGRTIINFQLVDDTCHLLYMADDGTIAHQTEKHIIHLMRD